VSVWSFYERIEVFNLNWSLPITSGTIVNAFLGFSAAMLGISGFESSANFVEEQEQGVSKTLRNMWAIVSFSTCNDSFIAYLYYSFSTSW
jgi:hypothetical protein